MMKKYLKTMNHKIELPNPDKLKKINLKQTNFKQIIWDFDIGLWDLFDT